MLETELLINRRNRPFKIPYIDEDWILGHTCRPKDIKETINLALKESDKYKKNRIYWSEQSCYKFDGSISNRIMMMIKEFVTSGKRIQL